MPRDDRRMVKGRHFGQAFFGHSAGDLNHRLILTLADDPHLGPQIAYGLHFVGRHQMRQADHSPTTRRAGRMGKRAAVVPG